MGIVIRLDEVMERRNMSLTELSAAVGITLANLSILKTGKARAVRFSTLESICRVLHCQPGDILVFNDEGDDYLTVHSKFFPRLIGVLLAIEGLGYLINSFSLFLAPALQARIFPYFTATAIAEVALCLWLLVMGVDVQRWKEQADAGRSSEGQTLHNPVGKVCRPTARNPNCDQ